MHRDIVSVADKESTNKGCAPWVVAHRGCDKCPEDRINDQGVTRGRAGEMRPGGPSG